MASEERGQYKFRVDPTVELAEAKKKIKELEASVAWHYAVADSLRKLVETLEDEIDSLKEQLRHE